VIADEDPKAVMEKAHKLEGVACTQSASVIPSIANARPMNPRSPRSNSSAAATAALPSSP